MASKKVKTVCFHCGDPCLEVIQAHQKTFCCNGCLTVYEILNTNNLQNFYNLNKTPGVKQNKTTKNYSYLNNPEIQQKLLDFSDGGISVVQLHLPNIHCSSCIWLLENLANLKEGIISSTVNFPKRSCRITFKPAKIGLKDLVELLAAIGYEPTLSLEDSERKKPKTDRSLLYKLGIAGFAFGNIMIMALPEYFDYNDRELQAFIPFFRWIMLGLSIPVVFYSASNYFTSAIAGLKHKHINIDVPIALGIAVLFLRSLYDILTASGPGYFDSLAGLVFFLTLGKFFQRKTYNSLSFERDYKSYFPVAVTLLGKKEESIAVNDLKKGDRILIRNAELIPADCILLSPNALIDNAFVTGEATPIQKQKGELIFAGGRQCGHAIELEVLKNTSQSYLTQLWNHEVFKKDSSLHFKNMTDSISKYFTAALLVIAFTAATYWYFINPQVAFTVFTAILIVACPCALALSAPFTLGNTLRIFGKNKFYVKNADTVENLAKINHIVWDKTGTLTQSNGNQLGYVGSALSEKENGVVKALARQSNHPLSRMIYQFLNATPLQEIENYTEEPGKGSRAKYNGKKVQLGSATYVGTKTDQSAQETRVYIKINEETKGYYRVKNEYRPQLKKVISSLNKNYVQSVLSGDGAGEKENLTPLFGERLYFNQKPNSKLHFIKEAQQNKDQVLMIGDGLNDAGALKQSNVGISISEDVNTFSPACDAILDARSFKIFNKLLQFSKTSVKVIKWSFVLSFGYNLVGLYFAATAQLSPVVSAILMPLSSITIVIFVTATTNILAKRKGL